jgi:hypothetical protein
MKQSIRLNLVLILLIALMGIGLTGCNASSQHNIAMADLNGMPTHVHTAPVRVQEAYQYAVANPHILQQIPCFCGCGAMGHTSNYSCYVVETDAEGAIVYDEHALDCGICVDISQDAMRLQADGKDVAEIFSIIDNTYARFGPPTPLEKLN